MPVTSLPQDTTGTTTDAPRLLLRLTPHKSLTPEGFVWFIGATPLDWEANPYWVRVALHAKGGPVPNYLTLSGGGREVELGAFLSPPERVELKSLLERELRSAL